VMNGFRLLAVLVWAAVLPWPSFATENCTTMTVAAAEIPLFVESATEGEFMELLWAAAKRADLDLDIRLYPKKRALNLFQAGAVDALVPHSSAGVELPAYKSLPILIKRDFVFVREGSPVPTSVRDLEGQLIGLTAQYAYAEILTSNPGIRFSRAPNSDLENIKMVSAGRFDGAVIEERSGLTAIAEAGVSNIIYDPASPINELQVWVLFAKTDCGRVYADKINAAFRDMISDKEWNAIRKLSSPNG